MHSYPRIKRLPCKFSFVVVDFISDTSFRLRLLPTGRSVTVLFYFEVSFSSTTLRFILYRRIVFIVWSTTKIRLMVFGHVCNGSFHKNAHTWWLPLRRCTVPASIWRMFCNFLQFRDATFGNSILQ